MDALGVTFEHLRDAVQGIAGGSGTAAVGRHVATMHGGVVVSVGPEVHNDRGIGRLFPAPPSKRGRACHADSITVRTENGASRVRVHGVCPKCGTGSGYLGVPAEHVHSTIGPHTSSITVDKCSVNTTCALETCEHPYRVHV